MFVMTVMMASFHRGVSAMCQDAQYQDSEPAEPNGIYDVTSDTCTVQVKMPENIY